MAIAIVAAWVVIAAIWPLIVPYSPTHIDLLHVLGRPSLQHWFGTDNLGRDVLSRVLAGSRSVLLVSTTATVLGVTVGTCLGLVAGYYRGLLDELIMRVLELFMALPFIVVALVVLSVLGPSLLNLILVVAALFAPYNARVTRSALLNWRDREFVDAARLLGESDIYIMFVELLPNIVQTIIVEITVRLAFAIFAVASLSFLGLGIQPPTPDWGLMVSESRILYRLAPWMMLFPSLAILSLVISVTVISRGTRRQSL